jgi:hypothetical protein
VTPQHLALAAWAAAVVIGGALVQRVWDLRRTAGVAAFAGAVALSVFGWAWATNRPTDTTAQAWTTSTANGVREAVAVVDNSDPGTRALTGATAAGIVIVVAVLARSARKGSKK